MTSETHSLLEFALRVSRDGDFAQYVIVVLKRCSSGCIAQSAYKEAGHIVAM